MRDRVYVGGTFDLFHPGHVRLLVRAARLGDVWVALNTDEFCERYKRRPVMSYVERQEVLQACKYVTAVTPNVGEEDSRSTIEFVKPKYIVHGDDWTGESYMRQLGITEEWLKERGMRLIYLPYTKSISTSEIIGRVVERV